MSFANLTNFFFNTVDLKNYLLLLFYCFSMCDLKIQVMKKMMKKNTSVEKKKKGHLM